MDWNNYPNFSKAEFDCQETGENKMRPEFLEILQQIRMTLGRPLIINSGYRSPDHSIERIKDKPGMHSYGVAADIKMAGKDVADFIVVAYGYGIRRFGINQRGAWNGRYVHIDMGDKLFDTPAATWSY